MKISRRELRRLIESVINENVGSDKYKWHVLGPVGTEHNTYFQDLLSNIIDNETPLKGRNELTREDLVDYIDNIGYNLFDDDSAKSISKAIPDVVFISSILRKKPGGDGMGCSLEIYLNGEIVAKEFGPLRGVKSGKRGDGSHQSDDDLKQIVKRLFVEAYRDVVDRFDEK